jgi:GrpB-like predicted nucleotidyltransferase (UPF0157 family)
MEKQLNQMTNEELGKLFPIIILEPDSNWTKLFEAEKCEIEKTIEKNNIIRIEHIGSTAIPDIKAKPTIDILLEINETTENSRVIEGLGRLNYQYIPRPENPAPHMMFVKGYTLEGFKGQAFHVHVRYHGDWDELYFRDYLLQNPHIAKEYEELKIILSEQFKNDRDAYTDKKTDFIHMINQKARQEKLQLNAKYLTQ